MRGMKLPRFSLRTLFVLITLISIPLGWVAYQLNWIRQRHEFLARNTARNALVPASPKLFSTYQIHHVNGIYSRKTAKSLSNFLWLFSEPHHDSIVLAVQIDEQPRGFLGNKQLQAMLPKEECELAERLFPEADFYIRLIWSDDSPSK